MKYSFLIPYHKRVSLFNNTLISFNHWYGTRNDVEILLGVDQKTWSDIHEKEALLTLIDKFPTLKIKYLEVHGFPNTYNPSAAFNLCAKEAEGKYFIITNPECFHNNNVLSEIDNFLNVSNEDYYFVCSCENGIVEKNPIDKFEEFSYKHHSWYQHSKYRNLCYHFCSIISRENYNKIGGFDERFMDGIAYDDDDFKEKISYHGIKIVPLDTTLVIHQHHPPEIYSAPDRGKRIAHNKNLYEANQRERARK